MMLVKHFGSFASVLLLFVCLSPVDAQSVDLPRLDFAADIKGESKSAFAPKTPVIHARLRGKGLAKDGDQLRSVWIAERVTEGVQPNHRIGEVSCTYKGEDAIAVFMASKPTANWPTGIYRVEVYRGDQLLESAKFVIREGL